MQHSVNQIEGKFGIGIEASFRGILDSFFYRNHYIAKKTGIVAGVRTFIHGERDNIGGILPSEIFPVKPSDLFIIHEQNPYFYRAILHIINKKPGQSFHAAPIDLNQVLFVSEEEGIK